MIGNNSAGSGSVRYGMTIDHVRALDVVLSDASRARFGPVEEDELARLVAPRPRGGGSTGSCPGWSSGTGTPSPPTSPGSGGAPGLPLERLASADRSIWHLCGGSEGTLVVITEATVGLVPKPGTR